MCIVGCNMTKLEDNVKNPKQGKRMNQTKEDSMKSDRKAKRKERLKFFAVLVIVAFFTYLFAERRFPAPDDFYFMKRVEDWDTYVWTTTIYSYDAQNQAVSEYDQIEGYLKAGKINEERTQITSYMNGQIVKYNVPEKSMETMITGVEIKERTNMEEYETISFTEDGVYLRLECGDADHLYYYDSVEDQFYLVMMHIEEYKRIQVVNDNIYYLYEDVIYCYNTETKSTVCAFDPGVDVWTYSISPQQDRIAVIDIIRDYRWQMFQRYRLSVYDLQTGKWISTETDYGIYSVYWYEDSYLYYTSDYGIFVDTNPTLWANTHKIGPDKKIYDNGKYWSGGDFEYPGRP